MTRRIFLRGAAALALAVTACAQDREVSWSHVIQNILDDQKSMWTFPARLDQPHDLIPTVAVAGIASGLFFGADPPVAHYFRNSTQYSDFNNVFSSFNTSVGPLLVPVGLYALGFATEDKEMKDTALLTGEAVVDATILSTALKSATGRVRPADISPRAGFGDSFWEGKNGLGSGSFPSGHTITAFAAATVISRRYGHHHRWVPFAAYGVAAAVGMSRLSLNAHFASDVFMGAVLGYSIGRFTVLHE